MPKTERILNVMQRVYERQNFTVGELAEEFSVSYRTMLRYLHELSRLGVPLYANEGKNGGYSILTSRQKRERSAQTNESIQRIIKPQTLIVGLEMKLPFTAYYMSQALKPKLWQELQDRMEEIPYVPQENVESLVYCSCFESTADLSLCSRNRGNDDS